MPQPHHSLRRLAWAALLAVGWTTASLASDVIHGADALFRGNGLTIGWAVARDRDDAKTAVLVSILDAAKRYDGVEVIGLDPFSNTRETVRPREALDGRTELRLPRNRFADLPRTELRFYSGASLAATIYWLGVPDTTPEFPDADAARRYLAQTVR